MSYPEYFSSFICKYMQVFAQQLSFKIDNIDNIHNPDNKYFEVYLNKTS